MSHETSAYSDIARDVASYVSDAGGDLQRYVITPAVLDMIGSVENKEVLDLYCGAGYLSRRLAGLGARVTGVDNSERLIGIAAEINRRESQSITYAVAEADDLSVVEDSAFDDIVCNMGLMLTRDLAATVAELARMVQLGGRFIFTVLHPCFCMPDACWARDESGKALYGIVDDYFREGWWSSDLVSVIRSGQRKVKHRTFSRYINALSARGFTVRRIAEPKPSPEVLAIRPHLEIYDRLPAVVVVEAIFPYL